MENVGDSKPFNTARATKRNALIGISVLSVVSTVLTATVGIRNESAYSAITICTGVAYGVAVFLWCEADAQERNIPLGNAFRIATVLFSLLALIYYLFRSRSFGRALIGISLAFLFIFALLIVNVFVNTLIAVMTGTQL